MLYPVVVGLSFSPSSLPRTTKLRETVHMSHVEQTGLLTRPFVTLAYAQIRVLHGHREPPEGHHLAAIGNVQVVECGSLHSIAGGGATGSASALELLTWE